MWWGDVFVIVLDGIGDLKAEFLIEVDGIFITCLHMQANLSDILLYTKIKNMI